MKSRLVLYQVCEDLPQMLPCRPVSAEQHSSKRAALADLRKCRKYHAPDSYLAQVIYTRVPETQKGR